MIIKSKYGQTIIDIATSYYGCYEGVFEIIKLNPHINLSYQITAGESLIIDDLIPDLNGTNQAIAAEFSANNFNANSGYVIPPPEGGFYDEDFYDSEFYD